MDSNEFAIRIQPLQQQLYRVAYGYLGSRSMALDAVGDAVGQGLRAARGLRHSEYFTTWMTRIVINQCKMELRRRRREQPLETLADAAAQDYDALPLKEAVRRLPDDLREVVILRYFAGFTLAQTAEGLRIPPGTAATRQRRALQILRLELSEEEQA